MRISRTVAIGCAIAMALSIASDGEARSTGLEHARAACNKECAKAPEHYKKETDRERRELICRAKCMQAVKVRSGQ
jgi:hypothetical protein